MLPSKKSFFVEYTQGTEIKTGLVTIEPSLLPAEDEDLIRNQVKELFGNDAVFQFVLSEGQSINAAPGS